jgi:hypothetical protein
VEAVAGFQTSNMELLFDHSANFTVVTGNLIKNFFPFPPGVCGSWICIPIQLLYNFPTAADNLVKLFTTIFTQCKQRLYFKPQTRDHYLIVLLISMSLVILLEDTSLPSASGM